MHFHLRGEKKVEKEGSSVQEQQRFQEQKNALTAYPYPALSKGILRPPKTRRTGKENQHNPLTEPLPNASAEALRLEAAGDSAPKCRSVPSSLGYSQCFTLTLPCPLKDHAHLQRCRAVALLGQVTAGGLGLTWGQASLSFSFLPYTTLLPTSSCMQTVRMLSKSGLRRILNPCCRHSCRA